MHDTVDHAAIVDTGLATRVRRRMWFKSRKLGGGQPEKISVQQRSPPRNRESRPRTFGNPFHGSKS